MFCIITVYLYISVHLTPTPRLVSLKSLSAEVFPVF